jgi:hypothetical protein
MSKQRRYSAEFKLDAVSRMEHCETITGLAKELGRTFRGRTYPIVLPCLHCIRSTYA